VQTRAMLQGRKLEQQRSGMGKIDALFFAFSAVSAIWLAFLLLRVGIRPGWPWLLLLVFWLFFSYLLLPRLHRVLTRLYVPGYFIGRARTSDGLLGDPVNLALLGREEQAHQAFSAAGWVRADDLDLRSARRIISSTLRRHSYPHAPVSPLILFGRQQDFAYQQEVEGSPSRRHHIRFWRCPDGWMLPGGYPVDWLAAGTYDKSVGLSLFTLQITHKIEENTDVERDFVVSTVTAQNPSVDVAVIRNFSTGYHARNGGGDLIETDGDLPVLDLRALPAVAGPHAAPTDSRDRRPAPTVLGASVTLLRALLYAAAAVFIVVSTDSFTSLAVNVGVQLDKQDLVDVGKLVAGVLVVGAVVDTLLAVFVLVGRNWARVWLMSVCVLSTTLTFVANVQGRDAITLSNLPTVGSSIIVLLALSSQRAREFATRKREYRRG
jgi:hypothetical protein